MQALGSSPARTGVRRAESPPGRGQPSTVLHAGEQADGQTLLSSTWHENSRAYSRVKCLQGVFKRS